MHCEACGLSTQGRLRCGRCHAVVGAAWVLGTAMLAWVGSVALFLVVSKVVFPDVAKMYDGLGAEPPLPARAYFALSEPALPLVALSAMAAPVLVLLAGRHAPSRFRTWSRRYALTASLGLAWALLGVAQWYLSVSTIINKLT